MILFILPFLTFVILFSTLYYIDKDKKKPTNVVKLMVPSIVISLLVFIFIKYRDNIFQQEPMMTGNYFE